MESETEDDPQEDRDRYGRPWFLSGPCDVCVEREDQLRFELQEYQDEPAAEPIEEVPDHHPMQPPNQIDLIQAWDTFGGPNPEDQLLYYRLDGAIVRRRYTNEEWDMIQHEAALLEDPEIYHDDHHSFSPSGYFNYLRAHPKHQSNMREHMDVHDQMIDEVRAHMEQQQRQQEEQPDQEEEEDLDEEDSGAEDPDWVPGEPMNLDDQNYERILEREGEEAAREWLERFD